MPFKSRKQERYLQINEPEIYQDWVEKYGHFKGAESFSAEFAAEASYCSNFNDHQWIPFGSEEMSCDKCDAIVTPETIKLASEDMFAESFNPHVVQKSIKATRFTPASKLRTGAFSTKEEAQEYRKLLKNKGHGKFGHSLRVVKSNKYDPNMETFGKNAKGEYFRDWQAESFVSESRGHGKQKQHNYECGGCGKRVKDYKSTEASPRGTCDCPTTMMPNWLPINLDMFDAESFSAEVTACDYCEKTGGGLYSTVSIYKCKEGCDVCSECLGDNAYMEVHPYMEECCYEHFNKKQPKYAESFSAEESDGDYCESCDTTKVLSDDDGYLCHECGALTCDQCGSGDVRKYPYCMSCIVQREEDEGESFSAEGGRDIQLIIDDDWWKTWRVSENGNPLGEITLNYHTNMDGRLGRKNWGFIITDGENEDGAEKSFPPDTFRTINQATKAFIEEYEHGDYQGWSAESFGAEDDSMIQQVLAWRCGYCDNLYHDENKAIICCKRWHRAESFSAELKRDSCCCGATKSKPCACMIQGVMECNATCPCSLEKSAESFGADPLLDYIKQREREQNSGTVKLQGMGRMKGTKAEDVRVGDVLLWNQGGSSQVLSITPKGKKSLLWKTRTADNREWERTVRKNRLVVVSKPNSYTAKKYQAESFSAEEYEGCQHEWRTVRYGKHPTKRSQVWLCKGCNAEIDSITKPSQNRKIRPNSYTKNWRMPKQSHYFGAESFSAEHFDAVSPLDGPCKHCGHDMFTESHKSWFCDRKSGGCGVVAHFVNPFGAESFSADFRYHDLPEYEDEDEDGNPVVRKIKRQHSGVGFKNLKKMGWDDKPNPEIHSIKIGGWNSSKTVKVKETHDPMLVCLKCGDMKKANYPWGCYNNHGKNGFAHYGFGRIKGFTEDGHIVWKGGCGYRGIDADTSSQNDVAWFKEIHECKEAESFGADFSLEEGQEIPNLTIDEWTEVSRALGNVGTFHNWRHEGRDGEGGNGTTLVVNKRHGVFGRRNKYECDSCGYEYGSSMFPDGFNKHEPISFCEYCLDKEGGEDVYGAESFNSYKVAPDLSSYTKAELVSSIAGPQGTAAYQEVVYDPIAQSRMSAETATQRFKDYGNSLPGDSVCPACGSEDWDESFEDDEWRGYCGCGHEFSVDSAAANPLLIFYELEALKEQGTLTSDQKEYLEWTITSTLRELDSSSYTKQHIQDELVAHGWTLNRRGNAEPPKESASTLVVNAEGIDSFSPTRLMVLGASIGVALGLYRTRGD